MSSVEGFSFDVFVSPSTRASKTLHPNRQLVSQVFAASCVIWNYCERGVWGSDGSVIPLTAVGNSTGLQRKWGGRCRLALRGSVPPGTTSDVVRI